MLPPRTNRLVTATPNTSDHRYGPRQGALDLLARSFEGVPPGSPLDGLDALVRRHAPLVLGLDGSLTAYGWGLVALEEKLRPIAAGCIATKPDAKSSHQYQADKDGARVDDIATGVLAAIDYALSLSRSLVVVIEAPAGAQHANAAKALGLSYGISRTACIARGLTPITVQAHEVKREVGGSMGASKDDVAAGVLRILVWSSPAKTKPAREAEHDAMGIAITGAKSPTADALRRAFAS